MKNNQINQLPLFKEDIFYISQSDAAKHLGITTRMINYWESQELLHPEFLKTDGKARKYTPLDLLELLFIKQMVVDNGYTIPSLKEKLKSLEPPYYYKAEDLFWDLKTSAWKTRAMLGYEALKGSEQFISEELVVILTAKGIGIPVGLAAEITEALMYKLEKLSSPAE